MSLNLIFFFHNNSGEKNALLFVIEKIRQMDIEYVVHHQQAPHFTFIFYNEHPLNLLEFLFIHKIKLNLIQSFNCYTKKVS